jgi:hypothetical protein
MPASRFGDALPPKPSASAPDGIYEWERGVRPSSMMTLDMSRHILFELISLPIENPFLLPLLRQLNILWVISENDDVYVAFEEMVRSEPVVANLGEPVILPRKMDLVPRPKKLGHGAMLSGGRGRIAGEICVETKNRRQYYWEINNQSGRYGRGCGRTKSQLEAAAREFELRNINLRVEFYHD